MCGKTYAQVKRTVAPKEKRDGDVGLCGPNPSCVGQLLVVVFNTHVRRMEAYEGRCVISGVEHAFYRSFRNSTDLKKE